MGDSDLRPDQILEIWKHFAQTGGADKERMVTIATWLLSLSATAIGYAATHFIESPWPLEVKASKEAAAAALAVLGLFVSVVCTIIVLLYAGYTTWNWAKADELARKYRLNELLPEECKAEHASPKRHNRVVFRVITCLARPRDPRSHLAPVFWIFLILAFISLLVHAYLLW
jgi:hypothetical protein